MRAIAFPRLLSPRNTDEVDEAVVYYEHNEFNFDLVPNRLWLLALARVLNNVIARYEATGDAEINDTSPTTPRQKARRTARGPTECAKRNERT
jgi:hypothetical protein